MHYAVPTIFHEAGLLRMLYNDWNALSLPRPVAAMLARAPRADLRRLAQRRPVGVPHDKNETCPGVAIKLHYNRMRASDLQAVVKADIAATQELAKHALSHGLGAGGACFTYDRAGLEVMLPVKERGGVAIMEQTVAPAQLLISTLAEEKPGFGGAEAEAWQMLSERERREWTLADLILCGSSFVRDAVIAEGAEPTRCTVVPYGVDAARYSGRIRDYRGDRPLRLLCVGEVGIRKGSRYLIEAARALEGRVQVAFVGTVRNDEIDPRAAPANVQFVGKVARDAVREWYEWADLFVLPSLFEGSATVTYEAMASGLPVICTEQTGSVVEHGETGLIVPARSSDALVEALVGLDRDVLHRWSRSVLTGSRRWDATCYGTELVGAARRVL